MGKSLEVARIESLTLNSSEGSVDHLTTTTAHQEGACIISLDQLNGHYFGNIKPFDFVYFLAKTRKL